MRTQLYKNTAGQWIFDGGSMPSGSCYERYRNGTVRIYLLNQAILFEGKVSDLLRGDGTPYENYAVFKSECGDFFVNPLNPLKEDVEGLQEDVEQLQIDVSAIQGGYLGTLLHTDAAPEPGVSGIYKFISAGVVSWLSGTPTVAVGDEVSVVFTDPTYTYTYIQSTTNAQLALKVAYTDSLKYYPVINYGNRVLADSGVISDLEKLTKLYIENLKLLDNTVYLWDGSAGMKTRTSGANTYAAKAYDMSASNNDAVQATEANQPFVGGGVAPNEKKRLKNLSTVSTRGLTHTQISFSATDNWSVTTVLKGFENIYPQSTGMYAGEAGTGNGLYVYRGGNIVVLFSGVTAYSTNDIASFLNSNIGKSMIVTWIYTANALLLFVNGVQIPLITTFSQFNFVFNVLFQNVSGQRNLAGEIYYHQIFNKALSASEVQAQHAYLRLQHPEIEGINIGNQHWVTSNYEGGGTGNGTIIPEVQDNAAWAALTTPAWCYYNNGPTNGAVYGKEYNLYGAQAINANAPAGYTIGTYAQWLQMVTLLGGTPVAGNKMKLNGTALWAIGNVGTNESGFTALPNGQRNADGTFSQINNKANFWTSDGYLVTLDYNAATVTFTSGANAKIGAAVRLLRTSPVGDNERTINTGYITNALGATNLDIAIPFGYQVESIRFDSETNITGLSAKLLTGALVELETLFTAKSVTANVQKVIAADADQSIQQTDAVVRINGTKANTASRFRVWVKITKVVFS